MLLKSSFLQTFAVSNLKSYFTLDPSFRHPSPPPASSTILAAQLTLLQTPGAHPHQCPSAMESWQLRPPASPARRRDRSPVQVVLAAAAAAAVLASALAFAGAAPARSLSCQDPRHCGSAVARAAADAAGEAQRPGLPGSGKQMVQQASQAALAAYRDGVTRQSVRLNLDVVCAPERVVESGMAALLSDAMPMAKAFVGALGLPGGAAMKELGPFQSGCWQPGGFRTTQNNINVDVAEFQQRKGDMNPGASVNPQSCHVAPGWTARGRHFR